MVQIPKHREKQHQFNLIKGTFSTFLYLMMYKTAILTKILELAKFRKKLDQTKSKVTFFYLVF